MVGVILALLIGLEAATLRRRKLLWWRWRDAGIVVADSRLSAEQRFFDRWVADAPAPTPVMARKAPPPQLPRVPSHGYEPDVIGMFPPPERILDHRLRMNTFLGKWLQYLAEQGHGVATLRAAPESRIGKEIESAA